MNVKNQRFAIRCALLTTVTLGLAACGGGSGSSESTSSEVTSVGTVPDMSAQCPLDAATNDGSGPIKINYWHAMTRANEETLVALTDEFNASQDDIEVALVNQNSYGDNFTKFETAYGTNGSPDLIQLEDTALQRLVDAQAVVPAQACLDADKQNTDDFVDRVADYYSVGGVLYPMPFNVSNPVLYYNKLAFEAAGLDPEAPPTNFMELRAAADALQTSGYAYGFAFKRDAWVLEQFSALAGEVFVNNDNGRTARATEVSFGTPTGHSVFEFLQAGVQDGVFFTNPASGPSGFDNLISICNGETAMTFDTSAALGTATAILEQEGCKVKVEVGVGALPLPNADLAGKGGVLVGGAANYLPANGDPARLAAAYRFAAFLSSPETQATWAAGTGYVPVRKSSADTQTMKDLWAEAPGYKVAFDQLIGGANNAATAGPLIGDYKGVREAMTEALEALLIENTDAATAIAEAVKAANAKILAYNKTV